jgi:hypothetical protein
MGSFKISTADRVFYTGDYWHEVGMGHRTGTCRALVEKSEGRVHVEDVVVDGITSI